MTDVQVPRSLVHYVNDSNFKWTRHPRGKGFNYIDDNNKTLTGEDRQRVLDLVIPPAWVEVKICQDPKGHIQAVGIDARGRKQYIYHPEWTAYQQQHKFDKMVSFGEMLPELRKVIEGDMNRRALSRERVVATVVWLLDHTFIRIGNQTYADQNQSYGLTTLREKHVEISSDHVKFSFKGKSGVFHKVDIQDARVARTIKRCIELPGYELFHYLDEEGEKQVVDSRDVNEYLQSQTGEELSAKDFRTWGGTSLAAQTLFESGNPESETAFKKSVSGAVKEVSKHLRNTPTVCRKYYIHPTVIETYQKEKLVPFFTDFYSTHRKGSTEARFSLQEKATWNLLKEAV